MISEHRIWPKNICTVLRKMQVLRTTQKGAATEGHITGTCSIDKTRVHTGRFLSTTMSLLHFAVTRPSNLSLSAFIPSFSVTCIAITFRHPSFDMLSKLDGAKSTNHSPLVWPFELAAHLHTSDMKQTPACIGCDRFISKSTSKDARNTKSGCKMLIFLHSLP